MPMKLCRIEATKKYFEVNILQERWNGLAMCCIMKDVLDKIYLDAILNDSVPRNARRAFFITKALLSLESWSLVPI